jgi:hypothetical protein
MGCPKGFKSPLMSVSNTSIMSAHVTLTASLSTLFPCRYTAAPERPLRFGTDAPVAHATFQAISSSNPAYPQPQSLDRVSLDQFLISIISS